MKLDYIIILNEILKYVYNMQWLCNLYTFNVNIVNFTIIYTKINVYQFIIILYDFENVLICSDLVVK